MSLLRILMMQVLVASFLSGNVLSGVYQANRGTEYDVGVNTNYANNYPICHGGCSLIPRFLGGEEMFYNYYSHLELMTYKELAERLTMLEREVAQLRHRVEKKLKEGQ